MIFYMFTLGSILTHSDMESFGKASRWTPELSARSNRLPREFCPGELAKGKKAEGPLVMVFKYEWVCRQSSHLLCFFTYSM